MWDEMEPDYWPDELYCRPNLTTESSAPMGTEAMYTNLVCIQDKISKYPPQLEKNISNSIVPV